MRQQQKSNIKGVVIEYFKSGDKVVEIIRFISFLNVFVTGYTLVIYRLVHIFYLGVDF